MIAPDDDVLAPIRRAILDLRRLMPSVRSATVTGVNPLRVQFDGETAPVSASPTTLVPVGPGDRVRVLHYGNTDLILGRVNTNGVPYAMAAGQVVVEVAGATGGSTPVTFPPGRFSTTPRIQLTKASGGGAKYVPYSSSRSSSGFTAAVYAGDGTSGTQTVVMDWIAVQMTPTSAGG